MSMNLVKKKKKIRFWNFFFLQNFLLLDSHAGSVSDITSKAPIRDSLIHFTSSHCEVQFNLVISRDQNSTRHAEGAQE